MITLSTIVWEGNFRQVLNPSSYFMQYEGEKVLVVNNVLSEIELIGLLLGTEFQVLSVKQYAEEAKKFFKLEIDESTKGYWYTIPFFVLLLKCKTKYLLNVSDDCEVNFEKDFIENSKKELKNPEVITTTLEWGEGVGKHESVKESGNFYYSKGFSDQVFFTEVKILQNIDYNINDDWDYYGMAAQGSGAVYHGGNSFERRLATFMKHNNKFRAIYKKYNYKHK